MCVSATLLKTKSFSSMEHQFHASLARITYLVQSIVPWTWSPVLPSPMRCDWREMGTLTNDMNSTSIIGITSPGRLAGRKLRCSHS